jgi:hypothetical protein
MGNDPGGLLPERTIKYFLKRVDQVILIVQSFSNLIVHGRSYP